VCGLGWLWPCTYYTSAPAPPAHVPVYPPVSPCALARLALSITIPLRLSSPSTPSTLDSSRQRLATGATLAPPTPAGPCPMSHVHVAPKQPGIPFSHPNMSCPRHPLRPYHAPLDRSTARPSPPRPLAHSPTHLRDINHAAPSAHFTRASRDLRQSASRPLWAMTASTLPLTTTTTTTTRHASTTSSITSHV
jgi:hypothetical protein